MNACLAKGDKVFLFNNRVDADGNAGYGDANGATARATKAVLSDDEVEQSATAGNMYEVVKVGVNPMSSSTAATEDRYYFVVDKVINWDGSATVARSTSRDDADKTATGNGQDPYEQIWMSHLNLPSVDVTMAQEIGLQMVVKFDTASAESVREYVAPCSGRGLCNEGNCEPRGLHGRQLQPPVRARVLGRAGPSPRAPPPLKSGRLYCLVPRRVRVAAPRATTARAGRARTCGHLRGYEPVEYPPPHVRPL